jgi:hypothetical protein
LDPRPALAQEVLAPPADRQPHCVGNPATERHQQYLYAKPRGSADDLAARRPVIRRVVRDANALLNRDSQLSGGPEADLLVRCESDGQIRVGAVEVPYQGEAPEAGDVVGAVERAGHDDPLVDYVVFYRDPIPGFCGFATLQRDERLTIANRNNNPGDRAGYAYVFGPCWTAQVTLHEIAHAQGAVQYSAPHSTGSGGHCNEFNDVMCYVDGGDRNQVMVDCPRGSPADGSYYFFDCDWDTYFDAAPEPGEWLSSHWNLGSPLNRFIVFGSPTTPPETSIESGTGGLIAGTEAAYAFSANEAGSSFQCSLAAPGAPSFAPCASPRAYSGLVDGEYEFSVRAIDGDGNADPTPARMSFVLDTGPPQTRIDSRPNDLSNSARASFSFSADEAPARFECRLDGAGFAACGSPFGADVGQGTHTFAVRAIDRAGHTDATPATATWSVDSVAPETEITRAPKHRIRTRKRARVRFEFAASEPSPSFECRFDEAAFASCGSPWSRKVGRGRYVFEVRAIDRAGNADPSPALAKFTVKRRRH